MNNDSANKNKGGRHYTQGRLQVNLMDESFVQMMVEIHRNHPVLWGIVASKQDVSEVLAEVGAYFGLLMEGEYNISKTCEDFYFQLRGKGANIILPLQAGQLRAQ